jgi:alkylhydroperoxidase/carboxymuconolactone decarboxylase family protein YurZ
MNQPELDLFNDKLEAHAREVERFHGEVANVTRQIANCDKLVRLANAGLSQIDSKIAEAVRLGAEAQLQADAAGVQAAQAATVATRAAVSEMVGQLQDATAAARKTSLSLNLLQLKTGSWIAIYAVLVLLCCLATGYLTAWALRGNALTPEQAHYVELGKAHEALLANASDKELKQITAIRNRTGVRSDNRTRTQP